MSTLRQKIAAALEETLDSVNLAVAEFQRHLNIVKQDLGLFDRGEDDDDAAEKDDEEEDVSERLPTKKQARDRIILCQAMEIGRDAVYYSQDTRNKKKPFPANWVSNIEDALVMTKREAYRVLESFAAKDGPKPLTGWYNPEEALKSSWQEELDEDDEDAAPTYVVFIRKPKSRTKLYLTNKGTWTTNLEAARPFSSRVSARGWINGSSKQCLPPGYRNVKPQSIACPE